MMTWVLTILLLALWLWLVVFRGIWGRARWPRRMPPELRGAKLWAAEKTFKCWVPIAVAAKPDQVFLLGDGSLAVAEVKTHGRVYDSDILQLSLSRFVLARSTRARVSQYGYARRETREGTRFERVRLLPDEAVISLYHRYHAILDGQVEPRKNCHPKACRKCAYKEEC